MSTLNIPSVQPPNAVGTAQREGEPPRALTFPVTELPPGKYVVRISAPGYRPAVYTKIDISAGRQNQFPNIVLEPER